MVQSVLTVRMDSETKAAFAAFCEQVGMSVSTAINLFARQTVREQRIPFEIRVSGQQSARTPDTPPILPPEKLRSIVSEEALRVPGISKAVLFGSYARGEATPESDIDLRIEYQDGTLSLLDLSAFSESVRERTGKKVDIVSAAHLGDDELARAIERDGVILYEREEQR